VTAEKQKEKPRPHTAASPPHAKGTSTLAVFGGVKGRLTGRPPFQEGLCTVLVGALASGAAYSLARLIST
jgi:hypothetical protein